MKPTREQLEKQLHDAVPKMADLLEHGTPCKLILSHRASHVKLYEAPINKVDAKYYYFPND